MALGPPAHGPYVIDQGCEGAAWHAGWRHRYGATGLCPPKRHRPQPWPTRLRRWLAGVRQIVATVYDKLSHTFRLDRERPHDLRGLQARLAAKVALHNCCLWLTEFQRVAEGEYAWESGSLPQFALKVLTRIEVIGEAFSLTREAVASVIKLPK